MSRGLRIGVLAGLDITSSVWTPRRSADGLVLSTEYPQLPLNTWLDVAGTNNTLNSVIETPHHPKAGTPAGGPDGSASITDAWAGAAWDHVSQRMILSGGGHGDGHECETGIYGVTADSLRFELLVPRQSLSQVQSWNTTTNVLQATSVGNAGYNVPQQNGVPGSMHTYWGMEWIPPGLPGAGSVKGGVYIPGAARTVVDLDSGVYQTTWWKAPNVSLDDVSSVKSFRDGSRIYRAYGSFFHTVYDLTQTESTTWSATSFGKFLSSVSQSQTIETTSLIYGVMRERREEVLFGSSTPFLRVRYGEAIDATASNWSSYTDTITLTSSDGSHSDFSSSNLKGGADGGTDKLYAAGFHYDHAAACIWILGNNSGDQLYKLTDLSGSTWTVEKIAGTGVRYTQNHGHFGRFRVATIGAVKMAMRVSGTTHPLQVMRLA